MEESWLLTSFLRVRKEDKRRRALFGGRKDGLSFLFQNSKNWRGDNLLFSEPADFTFEVVVLEFGVVIAADVGVIEGVVV